MWHFLVHGWLLFQSFPLLTLNMECVGASSSPQQGMKGSDQELRSKVGWCDLLTLWFYSTPCSHPHLLLCRPHSGTQQDLSATTAAHVILINLAWIQIRQASMSLQQKLFPTSPKSTRWIYCCAALVKTVHVISLFLEAWRRVFAAGNENWKWLTERIEAYCRKTLKQILKPMNWWYYCCHYCIIICFLFLALTLFLSSTLSKAIISIHEPRVPQCSRGGSHPDSSHLVSWIKHS